MHQPLRVNIAKEVLFRGSRWEVAEAPLTSAKEKSKQSDVESDWGTILYWSAVCLEQGATPKQSGDCCLHIHLGRDTERWHSLSALCYKPGDLSATTRPAVNWARFMEPATDYLQLSASQCNVLKLYLNNYVFPIQRIRLDNRLQSAWIMHVSLQHEILWEAGQ